MVTVLAVIVPGAKGWEFAVFGPFAPKACVEGELAHHFRNSSGSKIELGDAALGQYQFIGDVREARAGREAVLGIARRFVVDITAHLAQPLGGFDSSAIWLPLHFQCARSRGADAWSRASRWR